ncbi:MAG: hypothetical protein LBS69_02375 [Prevotellaceae bacterium]|jgi:hypothetical protein|nr:hypothetical protein [Prevotellaceae bacterium]
MKTIILKTATISRFGIMFRQWRTDIIYGKTCQVYKDETERIKIDS